MQIFVSKGLKNREFYALESDELRCFVGSSRNSGAFVKMGKVKC